MTIPSANLMENPVKALKSKSYQKAKGMSFFAFLFSIVIYISIFYISSLSPSALFNNTKFWFVISNTLILIIAADYGAYSSSKEKHDLYDEYASHSQARSAAAPSFVSQYPEIVKKSTPKEEETSLKEKKEDIVAEMNETSERILEVVKIEPENPTDNFQAKSQQEHEHPMKADNEACDQVQVNKKIEPKTIRRSKSHKVKRVTFHDKKNILQRSETEKHEARAKEKESSAEENEFSTMSDEELNRRVEEFIQKFNRQIRLQAGTRTRQFLEYE
ncbi:hypothetical protein QUC31_012626 [Theobroma cacao]|nr:Protein of unknown function DUF761 [Theobroma cacao]